MPRMPILALALAAALAAGCGGYSHNHRRGLAALGGAAVISGSVIAIDGAWCDGRARADAGCANDRSDLMTGLILAAAGLAVGGAAYLIVPRDEPARAEAPGPIVKATDAAPPPP
jgi:hypothetical protein